MCITWKIINLKVKCHTGDASFVTGVHDICTACMLTVYFNLITQMRMLSYSLDQDSSLSEASSQSLMRVRTAKVLAWPPICAGLSVVGTIAVRIYVSHFFTCCLFGLYVPNLLHYLFFANSKEQNKNNKRYWLNSLRAE